MLRDTKTSLLGTVGKCHLNYNINKSTVQGIQPHNIKKTKILEEMGHTKTNKIKVRLYSFGWLSTLNIKYYNDYITC